MNEIKYIYMFNNDGNFLQLKVVFDITSASNAAATADPEDSE